MKLLYYSFGFITAVVVFLLFGLTLDKSSDPSGSPQEYKIVSPKFSNHLNFAGEEVPLQNFEVRERVDREILVNTYWHSATLLALKRANRWFPVIEPILKENNVPDDFKYLCIVESLLDNVVSPAGATGFWQFVEGTGKKYGLEIDDQIDERYSVEKSTEAACKYFNEAYQNFGNWTDAAAAYNFGINGMTTQIEKQKAKNYYNLVLGEETSRYIPRVVAFKEIFKDPESFGFYLNDDDLYQPLKYSEVMINTAVPNWADFAIANGINYKTLKYFNPWLRDSYLTNKKLKSFAIKIPTKGSIEIIAE
jgi:hypothetical protein